MSEDKELLSVCYNEWSYNEWMLQRRS